MSGTQGEGHRLQYVQQMTGLSPSTGDASHPSGAERQEANAPVPLSWLTPLQNGFGAVFDLLKFLDSFGLVYFCRHL